MLKQLKRKLRTNKYTKGIYKRLADLKLVYVRQKRARYIHKDGLDLMEQASLALDSINAYWFFDFGTLLGIVREKQLINHDMDIDIGVIEGYVDCNTIRKTLTQHGFKLCLEFMVDESVVEESYLYKKIKMDIHYYKDYNEGNFCYLLYNDPEKEDRYKEGELDVVKLIFRKIEGTKQVNFQGVNIRIPQNAEALLEEKYGKDWRQPNKDWIYWEGPSAHKIDKVGTCIVH